VHLAVGDHHDPARRWRGTSDKARPSAVKSRVPSSPPPAAARARTTTGRRGRFLGQTLVSAFSAASLAAARSPICWLGDSSEDDDRDIALRRALLLDQRWH